MTGWATAPARVRRCTPAASTSALPKPPARRIVVAADHDDAGARVPQPGEPVGAELHGVHRRDRAVVDVAGDQNGVDLLGPDDADEMIKVGGLGLAEVGPVQRAAEVPIGRVQHPHGRDTSQPQSDTPPGDAPGTLRDLRPFAGRRPRRRKGGRRREITGGISAAGSLLLASETMRLANDLRRPGRGGRPDTGA